MVGRTRALIVLILSCWLGSSSDMALAADDGAEANPSFARARRTDGFEHWENGLDVKLTSIFGRSATNVTSPTMVVGAQWNYRFPTDSYLGFTASALPQSHSDVKDGVKRSFSTYFGGLNLAQALYESGSLRFAASLGAGKGIAYIRASSDTEAAKITSTRYTVMEPGVYGTFLDWYGMDVGAVASLRLASIEGKSVLTNSDLSGLAFGLTFRVLHH